MSIMGAFNIVAASLYLLLIIHFLDGIVDIIIDYSEFKKK